jgi:hypothetical protein
MGPLGGDIQWNETLDKFRQKVRAVKSQGLPIGMAVSRFSSGAISVLGYKAQICSIPPYFTQVELWAAHKILGIPLSLDLNAAFGMEHLGGVKIIRASHYMRSSMLRAVSKTLHGFVDMQAKLVRIAVNGSTCYNAALHDIRPPGWQSQAFVTNLANACNGLGMGMDEQASSIGQHFASLNRGEGLKGRQSLQNAFYTLLQSLTPPSWCQTLERKLETFDCLDSEVILSNDSLASAASRLKKLGPRIAMCVIKTWANAWTTSTRMHEAYELPCIFGCQGCEDDLEHYLICDPLWTVVISCSSGQSELLHAGPFTKLGLAFDDSSIVWWKKIAIAFSCYHAIKMSHRFEILSCHESGNFCQVEDRLLEYARVFSRELCGE